MTYRTFSKQQTYSYSDIINNKKNEQYKNQKNSNISIPYSLYLNNTKRCIQLCEYSMLCYRSPMNIIQAKTSYNCGNNIPEYVCKNPLRLYPYGLYLCDKKFCNNCIPSKTQTPNLPPEDEPVLDENCTYNIFDLFHPANKKC